MKKWKIYANANNTCVEFLKTVCRCSRMYNVSSICVRGKYNDRILNFCFNMPTFSSNKSQPSFKLGLQFICNIEIMSSIFLEPTYSGVWMKSHVWFFFEHHNFTFFFIRILWFHQSTISSIFDKCSMLQQMQSGPNHTSYRNFHFSEFVANVLYDNIRSKKKPLTWMF